MFSDIEKQVISLLQVNYPLLGGKFQVTEELLIKYIELYSKVTNSLGKVGKKSNLRFARKLAGLTFCKLQLNNGMTAREIKGGIIYLISNPAFPSHLKVGLTINLDKRLSTYQTYSPYRDFKVEFYNYCLDKTYIEKQILINTGLHIEKGEWVRKDSPLLNVYRQFVG